MAIRNYQDLVVWQKAMELCEAIYRVTARFPKEETYGLTSQMRRASVSVPSNIAEGQGRGSDKDWNRHLRIAYGSLRELETQLILAQRLKFLTASDTDALLERSSEVGRLMNGLMKRLDA
jgi:four helix bundle protein